VNAASGNDGSGSTSSGMSGFRAAREYCYINPVKHGYVTRVQDWPYSSFIGTSRRIVPRDWAATSSRRANSASVPFSSAQYASLLRPTISLPRALGDHGLVRDHVGRRA